MPIAAICGRWTRRSTPGATRRACASWRGSYLGAGAGCWPGRTFWSDARQTAQRVRITLRSAMNLRDYLAQQQKLVDAELDRLVPPEATAPDVIHRAMRYSLFAGGKRIRPILTIEAGRS